MDVGSRVKKGHRYLVDKVKVFVHIVCLRDSVAEVAGDTIDRVFWIESEGRMQRLWGQPGLCISSKQSPIHVICRCFRSRVESRKCQKVYKNVYEKVGQVMSRWYVRWHSITGDTSPILNLPCHILQCRPR